MRLLLCLGLPLMGTGDERLSHRLPARLITWCSHFACPRPQIDGKELAYMPPDAGSEIHVTRETVELGRWERDRLGEFLVPIDSGLIQHVAAHLLRADIPVLVDVGANVGAFALLVTQIAFLSVYSFEPSSVFRILEANVGLNNGRFKEHSRLKLYNVAISNATAEKMLCDGGASSYSVNSYLTSKTQTCADTFTAVRTKTVSLDDWSTGVALSHIDVLKVDAEGHDLSVIAGALRLIDRFHPVIVIEAIGADADLLLRGLGYIPLAFISPKPDGSGDTVWVWRMG